MGTTVVNKRHGVPFDVYIGRPSRWGNPFPLRKDEPRGSTISRFRQYAVARLAREPDWLEPLRGKVLACWCKPAACHGDVIVEMLGE